MLKNFNLLEVRSEYIYITVILDGYFVKELQIIVSSLQQLNYKQFNFNDLTINNINVVR